jgi:hypothetical protein
MNDNYIRLTDYKGYAIFRETLEDDNENKYCYWVFTLDNLEGDCLDGLMGNTLTETKHKIDQYLK